MEVIRNAAKLALGGRKSIALSAAGRSYSYGQLLLSAWDSLGKLESKNSKSTPVVVCNDATVGTATQWEDFAGAGPMAPSFKLKARPLDGARIGIMAKPCAEFVVSLYVTWLGGAVAVPLALNYPEAELMHVIQDAEVSIIMVTEEYTGQFENICRKCSADLFVIPPVLSMDFSALDSDLPDVDENFMKQFSPLMEVEDHKAGLIIYTSGTTGRPKGVVHTHGGMASQVAMLSKAWGYSPKDRFLHCLPLHHVHGIFNALLAPFHAGAAVEFLPKFSVRGIWHRWCESYPHGKPKTVDAITVFTGVPTMYVRLIQGCDNMDPLSQEKCASAAHKLRLMMCGSSALPQPIMTRWEIITKHRLLERYGMTEFGMALSNPLHGDRRPGTVGIALPGVQVRILLEENSEAGSEVGELCIKSPSMFKEYWKQPEVTKESFTEDEFFKTGDYVSKEKDGYIIILGRTSVDILKCGGYKLSALEIEAALLEHLAIAECAVLGLPDKDYGEVVAAVLVSKSRALESQLSLLQLHEWAKNRMAPYKIPQQLYIWESLPRNAMGKVNKKELKATLLQQAASLQSAQEHQRNIYSKDKH